jgi:hypothetical protein
MTDLGLSEQEKNQKTAALIAMVNEAVTAKLKSPSRHEE